VVALCIGMHALVRLPRYPGSPGFSLPSFLYSGSVALSFQGEFGRSTPDGPPLDPPPPDELLEEPDRWPPCIAYQANSRAHMQQPQERSLPSLSTLHCIKFPQFGILYTVTLMLVWNGYHTHKTHISNTHNLSPSLSFSVSLSLFVCVFLSMWVCACPSSCLCHTVPNYLTKDTLGLQPRGSQDGPHVSP
jgi:hypothetical protein